MFYWYMQCTQHKTEIWNPHHFTEINYITAMTFNNSTFVSAYTTYLGILQQQTNTQQNYGRLTSHKNIFHQSYSSSVQLA